MLSMQGIAKIRRHIYAPRCLFSAITLNLKKIPFGRLRAEDIFLFQTLFLLITLFTLQGPVRGSGAGHKPE